MTRSELIARLAERFPQLLEKDAEMAVKVIIEGIQDALHRGGRVEIRGFGSMALKERLPWTGRNPKTGETVQVPAKRVPYFKAGKELRDLVAAGASGRDG